MLLCCLISTLLFHQKFSAVLGRVYSKPLDIFYNYDKMHAHMYTILMQRSFGFLEDAEMKFRMTCPQDEGDGKPGIWLLFCSTAEAREFSRMSYNQIDHECERLSKESDQTDTYCSRKLVNYNTTATKALYTYSQRMEYNRFYTVILLQCPNYGNFTKKKYSCYSELVALNPGSQHLSSDEVAVPMIFTVINLIWATAVTLWFFNWVIYFKFSNRLHRFISAAPVLKIVLVVLVLLWWQRVANAGVESRDLSTLRFFVQSLENSLLFMTLMVIAEGWGVVRCYFKYYRWTSLFLLFLLFATSLMCVHWVHKYFLAFSICCVVFIMYKTLKWTSSNIELLRRRRRKIRRFINRHSLHYTGSVTIDMQLYNKLNIYHKFRIVCATFSMTYAIAVTLSTFLHEYEYIRVLVAEIPELVVYVAIGLLFRLRNFEPYSHIELVPPKENVVVLELPDACHGTVAQEFILGSPVHLKVEKETQTPFKRWRNGL